MAKKKMKLEVPDTNGSESSTDTTSDDGSNESSDSDSHDLNSNQHKRLKNKESKVVLGEIKLPCLHKLDENSLSSCLKNYIETTKQLSKDTASHVDITPCSTSNVILWWEEFTKLERVKAVITSESQLHKDRDTYESWFNKNAAHGSSWLCGSSPSSSSTLPSQKSDVEDIKVPSIYDNNPAPKGRRALKRERRAEREKTLGKKWFGMKAPDVDDKLKNDMDLIRMRSVLDPKRFYKHQDRKALPKYFQMGTVVDEGTDFFSSRLTKKQRKQTLVEELMADANIRQYNKKKYAELQHKMRGKKKFKNKPKKN